MTAGSSRKPIFFSVNIVLLLGNLATKEKASIRKLVEDFGGTITVAISSKTVCF